MLLGPMTRSFHFRFLLFVLVLGATLSARTAHSQTVLPRAGQDFTFGIIEGPYSFNDSITYLQQTSLTLTVVSAFTGCGVISSPSGYSQDFSFAPGSPTIVTIPINLIHINDLGKTEKGLLVHTTAPVNLVLHDYVQYGGDATQILPDAALDTNFVAFGWGIWDDVGENDNMEFIITATQDSTLVTITPSVRTMMLQPDSVPFTITLNRGECYIVKADTSGHPADPSLSGSTIHSTRPVSVISGLTCAYDPLQVEACNELMDELIGKKWWGSHFLTQPLDMFDSGGTIVLTHSSNFFAKINNNTFSSTKGRLSMTFYGPIEIRTQDSLGRPFPVEAHQLTRSYSFCDSLYGDPSLVSIIDTSNYTDTLIWNTPSYFFSHSVPIICKTADLTTATLDGRPLSAWGPSSVINGGAYSALNPRITPGIHKIISPDPAFAIGAGFYDADAYSFMVGTAGSPVPKDTISHQIVITADSARSCSEFYVRGSLTPIILPSEGMVDFSITITYDSTAVQLLQFIPGALLTTDSFFVDTSKHGVIKITVFGKPTITGYDLFRLLFAPLKSTNLTSVGISSISICGDDSEKVSLPQTSFPILPSTDSLDRKFLASVTNTVLCQPFSLNINTDSIVQVTDKLVISEIEVLYNSSSEQYDGFLPGALMLGKSYSPNALSPGDFRIFFTPATQVSGSNALVQVHFHPLLPSPLDSIRVRIFYLECTDTLEQDITVKFPVASESAFSSPSIVPFDSTVLCIPHDSLIVIGDTSCVPLTLLSATLGGSDWSLTDQNGLPLKIPATIGGNAGMALRLRFHPQNVGATQDSITLTFKFLDSTFMRTVALTGFGKATGTLEYRRSIPFDSVSLCQPSDSILKFYNGSCSTAKIDSILLAPPFSLKGNLPISIPMGDSQKVSIQYAPDSASVDLLPAIITIEENDTLFTDTIMLSGTGKASGRLVPPTSFTFKNASPCSPIDTSLSFTNNTCDSAYIDSIVGAPPFVLNGSLPISIGKNAKGTLPIRFAPDSIGSDTAKAIVEVIQNGSVVFDTIKVMGTSKPLGTLVYNRGIQFGNVSICAAADSEFYFTNTSCDSAYVDEIQAGSPFTISPASLSIPGGATDSFNVHYSPNTKATDSIPIIIQRTVNGITTIDTLSFIGTGVKGSANLVSTAINDSVTALRSECDPSDTLSFWLYNPGCDTLIFGSGFKLLPTGGSLWTQSVASVPTLPPGDSVKVTIISENDTSGNYSALFQTGYLDSAGIAIPFSIWVNEKIIPSPRTLQVDTSLIDFGTIEPCDNHDTVVTYTNTSCKPVNILSWNLSDWTSGFNVFGTGTSPTFSLAPGATDTLHITFNGSQTGINYDTVLFGVGTDSDSLRRIPVRAFVPVVDSVHFLLQMPALLSPKQIFQAQVFPDRAYPASKNLTSISGRLSWPDNDFTYQAIAQANGLTLNSNGPWTQNQTRHLDFEVSNAAGIALDPQTAIVNLSMEALLTDTVDYTITLDSVLLNDGNAEYATCTLATNAAYTVSAQYTSSCGDTLLIEQLRNQNLIFTGAPTPNPASTDQPAIIKLESFTDGIATIEIYDAIGRNLSEHGIALHANEPVPATLDFASAPAGTYFYLVRFTSSKGTVTNAGNIILLR